jgi:excisionase family DNA binding protein
MTCRGSRRSRRVAPRARPVMDDYVTLVEAAASLGVTPATLRAQSRKGRLRTEKLGRDRIIHKEEVERYRRQVQGSRRPKLFVRPDQALESGRTQSWSGVEQPVRVSQKGRRETLERLIEAASEMANLAAQAPKLTKAEAAAAKSSNELLERLTLLARRTGSNR